MSRANKGKGLAEADVQVLHRAVLHMKLAPLAKFRAKTPLAGAQALELAVAAAEVRRSGIQFGTETKVGVLSRQQPEASSSLCHQFNLQTLKDCYLACLHTVSLDAL
jgi:hypothetical protein